MLQTDHSESRNFVSERVGARRPPEELRNQWFVNWGVAYGDKINDMIELDDLLPSVASLQPARSRLRPSVAG